MTPPWPENYEVIQLGMGCFWGVERIFWRLDGVYTTAAGYAGGITPFPTYEEVCTGGTGHAEVVQVVFDPARIDLAHVLKAFWENHDPTQLNRQGNDRGTQYRSAIYWTDPAQTPVIEATREAMTAELKHRGAGQITTEITEAGTFYYAEDYHQQYLQKNPGGYCNHGPNGCSIDVSTISTTPTLSFPSTRPLL